MHDFQGYFPGLSRAISFIFVQEKMKDFPGVGP